jgi:CHRD domain-containing protein
MCVVLALSLVAVAGPAAAERLPGSDHGGAPLIAALTGPSGQSGTVTLTVNPGQQEVCFHITIASILAPIFAAHIHIGGAGVNGPIVVPFFNFSTPTTQRDFSGCVFGARNILRAILANPSGYYVNVHTTVAPAGAIRGQLSHPGS